MPPSPVPAPVSPAGSPPLLSEALEHVLAASRRPAQSPCRTLSARAAWQELTRGEAVLVDVRPAARRRSEGSVAGALVASAGELAGLTAGNAPVLVLCSDGTLAARAVTALHRLGAREAAAVVGGLAAWRAAGLPVD